MKSKVKITQHPITGEVFTQNENLGKDGKEYGYIRLEQKVIDFNSPMGRAQPRSAVKSFSKEQYENGKEILVSGMELPGNIFYKETTNLNVDGTPILGYTEKRANGNDDAPTCKIGGKKIYRTSFYTEDTTIVDELIQHDNSEEIKAYVATLTAISKASTSTSLN